MEYKGKTAVATRRRASNAAGLLQIDGNAWRVAIILQAPIGRTMFVQIGAADDNATGIPQVGTASPMILSRVQLGDGITNPIVLIDSGGVQQTFTWIEFTVAP
jgi:hypothetical protein